MARTIARLFDLAEGGTLNHGEQHLAAPRVLDSGYHAYCHSRQVPPISRKQQHTAPCALSKDDSSWIAGPCENPRRTATQEIEALVLLRI